MNDLKCLQLNVFKIYKAFLPHGSQTFEEVKWSDHDAHGRVDKKKFKK